jgi:tRNA-dihydrouridine synthase C
MAAEGGANWITIHARTRIQGYEPPIHWRRVGEVRRELDVPVVANGDIWSLSDLLRCQDETQCIHFMLGRGALADPLLPQQAAQALGLHRGPVPDKVDWNLVLNRFVAFSEQSGAGNPHHILSRLKQWLSLAGRYGDFRHFRELKRAASLDEVFAVLA